VTQEWEAAATMEAACITVALVAETSTQEDVASQNSVTILVKDVEDRATLAERKARERVSRLVVIPHSEKEGRKPPYVCPGCSNHTYSNNMITKSHVQ
jgi:hypothetical protein